VRRTCECPCRRFLRSYRHDCAKQHDEFPPIEAWANDRRYLIHVCTPCRMTNLRMLVTGSRTVTDKDRVFAILDAEMELLDGYGVAPVVVQGGARGVDSFARKWALARGYMAETHYPNYQRYGRPRATHVRNQEMVRLGAHVVVAITKDASYGTKSTINKARRDNLIVHIHEWDEE
jgi:hypothetical protein